MNNNIVPDPQLYSKTFAAGYLGISTPTLDRWVKQGLLPCVRIGKLVKFRLTDLNAVVQQSQPESVTTKASL